MIKVLEALCLVSTGTYVYSASLQRKMNWNVQGHFNVKDTMQEIHTECWLPAKNSSDNFLSVPEMQNVTLQERYMNQAKSCENKFSNVKLNRVEKHQKISFEKQENDISSNDSEEI